jgi:phenylpropionate dioxygenase-like ring-hydroxylating dioxygenase large terminal subunit
MTTDIVPPNKGDENNGATVPNKCTGCAKRTAGDGTPCCGVSQLPPCVGTEISLTAKHGCEGGHSKSAVQPQFFPTLNATDYSDPERYKLEVNNIFDQEWIYAVHESQLPERGSYLTFEIGDKSLLLVRGRDNAIRGFYNVCVHRGHILAKGTGKVSHLTCPYHAWSYNCDGQLRGARGVKRIEDLPESYRRLVPIEVEILHGFVFVRLRPGGPALKDLCGSVFDELARQIPSLKRLGFARRFVAEVDGNWKIMIENYLECYHCASTHPALVDLIRVTEFKIELFPYHMASRAPAGPPDNMAYKYQLRNDSVTDFFGWWLWPNLTFNVFPGQPNLLIFHMLPVSADKSIGICDYFFIDGKVNEEAQALIDWESNVLEKEDNDLIVSVHQGLKSQALRNGVFVLDHDRGEISEEPLAHFNALVSRAIAGRDVLHPRQTATSQIETAVTDPIPNQMSQARTGRTS